MTTHFGPYNNLGRTYSKLMGEWIPRSGRELRSAPCFEVYLNNPSSTEPGGIADGHLRTVGSLSRPRSGPEAGVDTPVVRVKVLARQSGFKASFS